MISYEVKFETNMAITLFSCVILIHCIVGEVRSGSARANFPLNNCREDTDILILLHSESTETSFRQFNFIIDVLLNLGHINPYNKRLNWNKLILNYPFTGPATDIIFQDCPYEYYLNQTLFPFLVKESNQEKSIKDINTFLEFKIEFVERAFNEAMGVRNTSVHVGVIFHDGTELTYEEIRNISSIVNRHESEVKLLVVIFNCSLVEEVVRLPNILILPNADLANYKQHLLMALCKTCALGWFLYEHKTGMNYLSCYNVDNFNNAGWNRTMSYCNKIRNGFLARIETLQEMSFLKTLLFEFFDKFKQYHQNFQISIGLKRELSNYEKRFQWVTNNGRYFPLLYNHWLPGEPSKACLSADCVVWRFTPNRTHVDNYVEGWANVECHSEFKSYTLCEVILPQIILDINFSKQAKTIHFKTALEKGDFVTFRDNIVSIAENVDKPDFLQFLRVLELEFPMFDCGEEAGIRRYISYSMVCDFVDHCSNRRDEISCLHPGKIYTNINVCSSGQILFSSEYWCDNVKDCEDGSDEENCGKYLCNSRKCCDGSCLPQMWLEDGQIDCFTCDDTLSRRIDPPHPLASRSNKTTCALSCNRETCILWSKLNDGINDCLGAEGPIDETIGKLVPANTCRNRQGKITWAPKCHYIKYRYGGIIGCRDMSHLIDCENFDCGHGYVKCYYSYCIPQRYLHDGKADCPTGEDENVFYTGPCTGKFACWKSKICLHPDLVCNGHPDCPYYDDELDCHVTCPEGFRCIAGTLTLSDYNRSVPLDMRKLLDIKRRITYMDLSGVELKESGILLQTNKIFLNLKVLILSKCRLHEVPPVMLRAVFGIYSANQLMVQKLDISYNHFFKMFPDTIYCNFYRYINYLNASYNRNLSLLDNLRFNFLEIIDVSYTSISYLNDSVFEGLPRLKHLNLSHTFISDFSGQYFPSKLTLQTLDLRGIGSNDIHDYSFHGLTISHELYTDHFQVCCPQTQGLVISSRACIAPADVDSISSCFHLLGLNVQRVLLWIVAVLAVLGNMTVIVYRIIWDRSVLKKGYGVFVTNLGISDFIMGVYLFIIAGADYFYRDNYVLYDKNWRNSYVCQMAGFMACLSCEASTFFVFMITLDRFWVMKFPFGQIKCPIIVNTFAVTMSWMVSLVLSVIPIILNFEIYSSNAMCLGLPLTNTHAKGWGYSVGVFIIFNFLMFLLIACGQYAIFRAMSQNRIPSSETNMFRLRRVHDIQVAKQLSLVVVSNFLFWFPVGLIGLLSMGGHEISNTVYSWITVLLLPINAAVNPVIYTIPALNDKWEKFKHGDRRTVAVSL